MSYFLNLKNSELRVNTFRDANAEVTTKENLLEHYSNNSSECLTASITDEEAKEYLNDDE
jgi:hypothetical protein